MESGQDRRQKGEGGTFCIRYVNGATRSETEIGKLVHDFNCRDADEMHFDFPADVLVDVSSDGVAPPLKSSHGHDKNVYYMVRLSSVRVKYRAE